MTRSCRSSRRSTTTSGCSSRATPSLKVWNSLFIATVYTGSALLLCALGGYAFAKFRFPGRRLLFALMLATLAIPFAVVMVPLFILMRNVFDWIDTPWPLIVPTAANAFGIFFMRQYLQSLPDEMLDAARVDGASELAIFLRIVLPTSIPGLASLGIIFFMARWNDFLWPLAVLRADEVHTVPLMLIALQGPPGRTAYDVLMAGLGRQRPPDAPAVPVPPALPRRGRHERRGQGLR